jgi:DNA-binding transcriptional MerR regulator
LYSDAHLSRLRLIGSLLERGYTLANIAEMIHGLERGHDLGDLVGLGAAIVSAWSDEVPGYVTPQELAEMFGGEGALETSVDALQEAVKLGLVEVEGDRFRVPSPRLLHAGAELYAAGVPLDAIMDIAKKLRRDTDRIAARFVELAETYLFAPYGDELPPPEDVPRITELVRRLRPLTEMAVDAELARAMERRVAERFGKRLDRVREQNRADADAS